MIARARHPRVLLATPFSPLLAHDHAANDIALPLMKELAKAVDLHVYGADGPPGTTVIHGFTHYGGTPKERLPKTARLGRYPYRLRSGWRAADTDQFLGLIRALSPSHVHLEYLQTAEVLWQLPGGLSSSMTLHDITGRVLREGVSGRAIWERPYRLAEAMHVAEIESSAIRRAGHIIALSAMDAEAVRRLGQSSVSIARLGVTVPDTKWTRTEHPRGRVVFGGAMWRAANEESARFLAETVMPLVWETCPDIELHIIGARPTRRIEEIGEIEPRVVVRGAVDDFDSEFLEADLVLAPSMVRAGILLKALRSLALGCPTVLNRASAAPLAGLEDLRDARVAETARDWAAAIVELTSNAALAAQLGEAGRSYVESCFSWSNCAAAYVRAFEQSLEASH